MPGILSICSVRGGKGKVTNKQYELLQILDDLFPHRFTLSVMYHFDIIMELTNF